MFKTLYLPDNVGLHDTKIPIAGSGHAMPAMMWRYSSQVLKLKLSLKFTLLWVILPALIIVTACRSDHIIYKETIQIPIGGWAYDDVVTFVFEIMDTSASYTLMLDVKHSNNYGNQNIYTRITTTFPDDSVTTDIVSLELASAVGFWNGRCRGNACVVSIPLQSNVRFRQNGTYQIGFEQYMRNELVEGIEALSLAVRVFER